MACKFFYVNKKPFIVIIYSALRCCCHYNLLLGEGPLYVSHADRNIALRIDGDGSLQIKILKRKNKVLPQGGTLPCRN
jgi:hypothetical protein